MQDPLFSNEQITQFAQQGFIVVRQLAEPAQIKAILAAARDHLARAVEPIEYEADTHYPGAPASRDATGGHTARRLRQVFERDEAFRDWATSPAVRRGVQQLLGDAPVALTQAHHNSLMTKQPAFSSVTHWHRDIRYWHFADNNLVSVWLALGPEVRDNGSLSFIPGTHTMDIAPERYENLAFLRADLPENQALINQAVSPELAAGDVVFFHAKTFHAAGWNRTDHTKYSLVFSYHRQDNLPTPGTRSASLPSIPLAAE